MVILVVLPLSEVLVEEVDVIADAVLVEEVIELLVVDAVRSFELDAQVGVGMADVEVRQVSVKARLKLVAVVGLDHEYAKRQPVTLHR